MKKILITLTFLLMIFSVSSATKYYISTTGVTGNTGLTSASPKGTLDQVFTAFNLGTGDTIFVAAGTYTETGIVVGSDDEGFVIQGASLSSGIPTSIFDATSTSRWLLLNNSNNDNITINKLTIKDYITTGGADPDGGGAIKIISTCSGTTINSCVFNNCDTKSTSGHRGGAIYSVSDISITNCSFYNCDSYKYGGAISLELTLSANCTIDRCTFYSNTCTNNDYGSAIYCGVTNNTYSLTIKNSLFYNNATTSGTGTAVIVGETGKLNITNCTITKNGNTGAGTGGVLSVSSATLTMKNTIIYANVGTTYNDVYNNSATLTMTSCCYGNASEINSITTNTTPYLGNPLFVNAASNDYSLMSTSLCVDPSPTYPCSGAPSNDILNATRDSDPDIGAYEYGAIPLPIELVYFDGDPHINYNKIYWLTASEHNNDYFDIYRSIDGVYFNNIFTVKGAGNSTHSIYYEVIDRNFEPVINYYVLRQTDFDGRWKESDIISIDNRSDSAPLLLKVTNLLGQEVNDDATGVILYHYSDGTILKRIH